MRESGHELPAPAQTVGSIAALAVCIAIASVSTMDMVSNLGTHLDRSTQDTYVHYWVSWWLSQAMAARSNPYDCSGLFYPQGVSLATHNISWFNAVFALNLGPLIGDVASYNLSILVSLVLCGLSAYALCYRLTGSPWASLVGAAIYEAWPFRISHLGHPNMLATQWIPVVLLVLLNVFERQRWRDGVWLGIWLALVAYTRYQLGLGVLVMGGILVLFRMCRSNEGRLRTLLLLVIGIVICAMLLIPAILLLGDALSDLDSLLLRPADAAETQADLVGFVLPWYRHPLYGEQFEPAYERIYASAAKPMYPVYVGFVALALAFVGLWTRWRTVRTWAAMATALALLAIGPTVRVNGTLYPRIPTLWRALEPTKVLQLVRFPHRYVMFLALPTAVLAACVAAHILAARERAMWRSAFLALVLCGIVVFDYLGTPLSLRPIEDVLSPGLTVIAADHSDLAVLNLPIGYKWVKRYMLEQTVHEHAIVQGHISRTPPDLDDLAARFPSANLTDPDAPDLPQKLQILADRGVGYLILHPELMSAEDTEQWETALNLPVVYEDELVIILKLSGLP